MEQTSKSIQCNLESINPNQKCSCDDLKIIIKGCFLAPLLIGGYFFGTFLAIVNGLARAPDEAIITGSERLNHDDILGSITGGAAGALHGLNSGGVDGFFTGLGAPSKAVFGPPKCADACNVEPEPHCKIQKPCNKPKKCNKNFLEGIL